MTHINATTFVFSCMLLVGGGIFLALVERYISRWGYYFCLTVLAGSFLGLGYIIFGE